MADDALADKCQSPRPYTSIALTNQDGMETTETVDTNVSWTDVISKRRRLSDSNQHIASAKRARDPRIRDNNIVPTNNRFESLPTDVQDSHDTSSRVYPTRATRPPPIYLNSEVEFLQLQTYLTAIIGAKHRCMATKKGIVIYTEEPTHYRKVVQCLRENNAEFHTFQLKEDKAFRVVIRGLHHSIPPDTIKNELVNLGYNVRNVTNVISRDKVKLPLFYVDLEPNKNNSKIFELLDILRCKIAIEEPRQNRQIVQCVRCQRYGHTKAYCNMQHRCVRCAGNHESSTCTKKKDTPATCVLCGEAHPSNYRGCSIHRELQNRRAPRKMTTPTTKTLPLNSTNLNSDSAFPNLPMAQTSVIKSPVSLAAQPERRQYLSYSQAVTANQNLPEPPYTNQSSSDNISIQLTSFIKEIKDLFTPVITMMNHLLQMLITNHGK